MHLQDNGNCALLPRLECAVQWQIGCLHMKASWFCWFLLIVVLSSSPSPPPKWSISRTSLMLKSYLWERKTSCVNSGLFWVNTGTFLGSHGVLIIFTVPCFPGRRKKYRKCKRAAGGSQNLFKCGWGGSVHKWKNLAFSFNNCRSRSNQLLQFLACSLRKL